MDPDGTPIAPFANIVAVCDLDHSGLDGLRRAMAIARAQDGQLTALTVRDCKADIAALARFADLSHAEIEAGMMTDLRTQLSAMIQPLANGRAIGLEARIGRPFRAIIGDVLEHGRDLVVKMAEPFDGAHRYLFTSTDQHLIRKCPCPVWLAMPGASRLPKTVLAAVDLGEDKDETDHGLNRAIIETAWRVAAASGAALHITHVWEAPAEDLLRRWSNDGDDVRRYLDSMENRRRHALEMLTESVRVRLAGDGAPSVVTPHLARGRPRDVIPAHIDTMGVDLLVIGTLARTGVPGLIIGNTAEDVLNAVECSVLTVKPPGYVSPLAL